LKTIEFILGEEDFLFLERMLLNMGYRKITPSDSRRTFRRLNLSSPRPIEGRETSYRYNHNGYTVILHTSYLELEKKWRNTGTDIGWNLIAEGDKVKYFARPFQRKKGFILKFLRYAWISKWKVDNRPLCPACNAYMHVHRKKGSRQYFWACWNSEEHPDGKPTFLSWDYNLPPKALEFVKIRRDYAARYNAQNKKNGKIVVPAAVKRRRWKIGSPENLV
jgi:hypothetical protein